MTKENAYFYQALTPDDMRRTEQMAFDRGVPSLLLMEHAAIAVVDALQQALGGSCQNKTALFLCGTGNNGGDGLAAARLFRGRGGIPVVWLSGSPKTPDANTNLQWLRQLAGVEILRLDELPEDELPFDDENRPREFFDAYVDALLGTGLRGAPEGLTQRMLLAPDRDRDPAAVRLAVDIPSGIDGATGAVPGACFRADVTVTFHAPKLGLYLTGRRDAVGRIVVADIGLDDLAYDPAPWRAQPLQVWCRVSAPRLFKTSRPINAHKGDCGRILIYAGSMGMAGAAAMCAKAAVTAGAGLTTVACPQDVMPILQTLTPNAMCADITRAVEQPSAYDVLALGCGLSQSEEIWQNILRLWDPAKPSVWDADALNLLSLHPMSLGKNAVITPHPGEAARLLGWRIEEATRDKLLTARALAEKYGCTAVLKGDVTVICVMSGQTPYYWLNVTGSPALAKGGSGDALTGILAVCVHDALPLGSEWDLAKSAARACLWHGLAAIAGAERYGERELTTAQLIDCLHAAETRRDDG
ncbi:MAG: NAD(P)H-hydrate dehydratase [Clostridia bacterium]|nr:NAD(P)H-hydrate dehydratase [Clostridia bacterium]